MGRRLLLQSLLENLMGDEPEDKLRVYFQPPNNVKMEVLNYPCFVFKRDFALTNFADNVPYRITKRWQVTWIDRDPDSPVPDKLAELPMCTFNRFYTKDDLNHDVYNLFF